MRTEMTCQGGSSRRTGDSYIADLVLCFIPGQAEITTIPQLHDAASESQTTGSAPLKAKAGALPAFHMFASSRDRLISRFAGHTV